MKKIIVLLVFTSLSSMNFVQAEGNIEIGRALSTQCSTCHGIEGMSNSEQFPNIAGQKEAYLISTLEQYKSGERTNGTMAAIVGPLNTQNIKDLAAYFASNTPVLNYSFETKTLSIPYANIGDSLYSAEMLLISEDDLLFQVKLFEQR
jgi:cytochrome c553